jgi:hypothetical protein
MRLSNNYILNFRNITIAVCFAFWALNNAQAQTPDDNRIWTTVGSAGTVDETDATKVFFDHSVVQMGRPLVIQPAARKRALFPPQIQSAVIRYNVTAVDGLFAPTQQPCAPGRSCSGPQLTLRYLATGRSAQVVAKLIEVDLVTGVETDRLTFNSNAFAATNGYQVQGGLIGCDPLVRFDFKRKAYYIEATLKGSRFVGTSAAGIQMIKIDIGVCIR